jgi:hypothetical protein
MHREHHQALTKNYVLLVNETPMGKVLDELVQNKILDDEMREFICHHPTRKGRTRALMGILPRSFPCFLLCFAVLEGRRFGAGAYQPRHRRREHGFPGSVDEGAYQPRHRRHGNVFSGTFEFLFGGNLYLIAEQDGILLTDKNTKSDIYFPLVRWVQLQTIWGYIDDAVHYLEHNNYTSIDVHLGANVFVTAECPVLHLDIRHYYWMNDKRYPSSHGVSLDFDQYQKLKDVDRVLPDIVPDLKKTLPCQSTHQNVDSAIYCSECNPCCI